MLVNHQLEIRVSSDNYDSANESFVMKDVITGDSSVRYDLTISDEPIKNNEFVLVKKGKGLAATGVKKSVCIIASTDSERINEAAALGAHKDTLTFTAAIELVPAE